MRSKKLLILLLLIPVVISCTSQKEVVVERTVIQGSEPLTRSRVLSLDTYKRAEALLSFNTSGLIHNNPTSITWVNRENLWYQYNTERGVEYFLVNVATGRKSAAFDQILLAQKLTNMTGKEIEPWTLPINNITFDEGLNSVRFNHERTRWQFNMVDQLLEKVDIVEIPAASNISPDMSKAVYIKDHNLWMRDLHSGVDTQLTFDGEEYYGYATNSQGWSRSNVPIVAWSPDSRKISTYRLDERGVPLMHLLETASPRAKLHSWPYAVPGDTIVPMHERIVIDVDAVSLLKLNTPPDHQRTSNCCGLTRGTQWADNEFSADGSQLAFVSTSRDYKTVTLRIADTKSGDVRTIYEENHGTPFESNLSSRGVPNWRVLHTSNEFLWFTRADEWGHLYLHDLSTGQVKNRITSGAWNVLDLLHVDEVNRVLIFSAIGREPNRDPYQAYIYSVKFDGSNLTLLTSEVGDHSVWFSPDATMFVNKWSDFQNPPTTVVRDLSGYIKLNLEKADVSKLKKIGWNAPEPFVAKARDGVTDIYGIMFKPSDFDPEKQYPIINQIYPGPQVGSIRGRDFSTTYSGQAHALAELGFIVVQVDAMGTPLRSKSFHTFYGGDMADNGLPDQIAAMRQLAKKYPWIDLNRAGMYGHSGGGFATAAAMFIHPDFFKVGVSSAGNHDNSGYTYYWGEKFQGLLVENDDKTTNYTNQSLPLLAENLKGKLLISYGSMDSNVHPNMTLQVINELIKADKDFDVMVYPNRGHGYFNEVFNLRLTWNYFVKHLMGAEPNPEFRIVRE
jgi:dipeptidyl-peptidase-4